MSIGVAENPDFLTHRNLHAKFFFNFPPHATRQILSRLLFSPRKLPQPSQQTANGTARDQRFSILADDGCRHCVMRDGRARVHHRALTFQPQSYLGGSPRGNSGDPVVVSLTADWTEVVLRGTIAADSDNIGLLVELITPVAMEKTMRFAIREGGRTVGAGRVGDIIE